MFLGSKSMICNLCFVIFKYDNYLVLIYLVKNICNRTFEDDVTLTSSRNKMIGVLGTKEVVVRSFFRRHRALAVHGHRVIFRVFIFIG